MRDPLLAQGDVTPDDLDDVGAVTHLIHDMVGYQSHSPLAPLVPSRVPSGAMAAWSSLNWTVVGPPTRTRTNGQRGDTM